MGKKDAQRTKGNVKPSSSARSAELLTNVSSTSALMKQVDITSNIFGLTPLTAEEENLIPDELKMALKKLSKKDSTTKLKALQEFCDLCSGENGETECKVSVEGMHLVLPYWPRLYSRLSLDLDRRVREASQKAHLVVVSRVGRDLAPYLKSLVPSWHLSCSDPHLPASSLALKAFLKAFNGDETKLRDAILFCQAEIVSAITENLLQHTPSTLSDPKTTSKEDMEEKFVRVQCVSLIGYGGILDQISLLESEDKQLKIAQKAQELHFKLISNSKFWKLAHHQNVLVKQAWYCVAGSLSKVLPAFIKLDIVLEKQVEKLVCNIMGKLDEMEPTISPKLWDSALQLIMSYEEWHRHIEVKTAVLPKVSKLLRSESHTLAGIYPRLLPLLHKVPLSDIDSSAYLGDLLPAIRSGMKTFVIQGSAKGHHYQNASCQSGGAACVAAFFEVSIYGLKSGTNEEAILSNIFQWIEDLLANKEHHHGRECESVFSEFGKAISCLEASVPKVYDAIWNKIAAMMQESAQWQAEQFTPRHFLFLYAVASNGNLIASAAEAKSTGSKNVKFGLLPQKSAIGQLANVPHFQPLNDLRHKKRLSPLLASCVQKSLDFVLHATSNNGPRMENGYCFAISCLQSFCPGCSGDDDLVKGGLEALMALIGPQVLQFQAANMELHVSLCVNLLNHTRTEKTKFYDKVTQLSNPDWVLAFVSGFILESGKNDEDSDSIKNLISSETFTQKLLQTLRQPDLTEKGTRLLLTSMKFASLMPEEKVAQILDSVIEGLEGAKMCDNSRSSFAVELVQVLSQDACASVWRIPQAQYLAEALFNKCLENYTGELDMAWYTALSSVDKYAALSGAALKFAQEKATVKIRDKVEGNGDSDKMVRIVSKLIKVFPTSDNWQQLLTDCVQTSNHEEVESMQISKHALRLVNSKIEPSLCCIDENSQFPVLWSEKKVDFFTKLSYEMEHEYANLECLDVRFVSTFAQAYVSSLGHDFLVITEGLVCSKKAELLGKNRLASLLANKLPYKLKQQVVDFLQEHALIYGHLWAFALNFLRLPQDRLESLISALYDPRLEERHFLVKDEPTLHVLQSLVCSLDKSEESAAWVQSYCQKMAENIIFADFTKEKPSLLLTLALWNSIAKKFPSSIHGHARRILSQIDDWKREHENQFLFECDATEKSWSEVMQASIFADAMAELSNFLSEFPNGVNNEKETDLLLCSATSWTQTLQESKESLKHGNIKLTKLAQSISHLVASLSNHIASLEKVGEESSKPKVVEEWHEFFAQSIFPSFLSLFVDLAPGSSGVEDEESLLSSLGEVLRVIPDEQLIDHELPPKFFATDVDAIEATLPNHLVTLLNHLGPLISSASRSTQITAFFLLKRIMPEVLKAEESRLESSVSTSLATSEDDECELPRRLDEIISKNEPVLEGLFKLADLTAFGEPLPAHFPVPSAAYTATTAYLLTWKLALSLMSKASAELRPKYSAYLRKNNYLKTLMETLFHIMTMKTPLDPKDTGSTAIGFGELPKLNCLLEDDTILMNGQEMHQLACSVYHSLLKHLPALVRGWWNLAENKIANVVEKFTCTYVTPTLWSDEVKRVQQSKSSFDNMTIKVRASVREVVAIYTIDEGSMELVVQLPSNFPLGPVNVDSGKRVGVTAAQWRTWMLQLTTFLQHQNGSLVEALTAWKKNVDKRFEGVEECYICFFILHGSTYQMPKVACPTCKKKFHSACLYKWFSTSQNSTCPLCRNLF